MSQLRILDLEVPESPYLNLALEEAIATRVGREEVPETLRFWRNYKAIVIGRLQCPSLEADFETCLKEGITLVRRFTGGGAVYHDMGNLNFSLFLKRKSPLIKERLFRGYELVGKAVEISLRKMGLKDGKYVPINSVKIGDKKVCGMAGFITRDFVLVHGSILVSSNLKVLNRALIAPPEGLKSRFVRSKKEKVTSLERALKRKVKLREVKEQLIFGLEAVLGLESYRGSAELFELSLAEQLYFSKYSKMSWSLGPCVSCPRRKIDEIMFKRLTFSKETDIGSLFKEIRAKFVGL